MRTPTWASSEMAPYLQSGKWNQESRAGGRGYQCVYESERVLLCRKTLVRELGGSCGFLAVGWRHRKTSGGGTVSQTAPALLKQAGGMLGLGAGAVGQRLSACCCLCRSAGQCWFGSPLDLDFMNEFEKRP